jgi:hypothetical protein
LCLAALNINKAKNGGKNGGLQAFFAVPAPHSCALFLQSFLSYVNTYPNLKGTHHEELAEKTF